MPTSIHHIASIVSPQSALVKDANIAHLLTDSRKLIFPASSLFFALQTESQDGHKYIAELVKKGVFNFVVNRQFEHTQYRGINFLVVENVLAALHLIASKHRNHYEYPVIGITGSNGKTIVKEWMAQIMANQFNVVRSPRSYNSQIGVPLSVWEMSEHYNFGIFEAGISQKNEMDALEKIIQPTIGVLTNIGSAHEQGFMSIEEKLSEKVKLFTHAKVVIVPFELANRLPIIPNQKMITWGKQEGAHLHLLSERISNGKTMITGSFYTMPFSIEMPFVDRVSIQNVIICLTTLLHIGLDLETIQLGVNQLRHLEMRMQIKKGLNHCQLLNDSYSNDLHSLVLTLDYAKQQSGNLPITLILSDFSQTYASAFEELVSVLLAYPIRKLYAIGPKLFDILLKDQRLKEKGCELSFFENTDSFLSTLDTTCFKEELIVLKGARKFKFEKINTVLQLQLHQTQMEVNLTALANNYKLLKSTVGPRVKVMAMVKAFGYGSGSVEVASVLQFHHADYLAVAYVDEGVELRRAGIHLPIMVMNVDATAFDSLVQYHLEPELYSLSLTNDFLSYIQQQGLHNFPVHLKLNTGMNRLGFDKDQIPLLCELLNHQQHIKVQSIFSHLSASGQDEFKLFTLSQLDTFNTFSAQIETTLGYETIKHIANSGAIFTHPNFHLDMVRMGIALYGIGVNRAENVVQLKTTIAQIRKVSTHETVGYSRSGVLKRDSVIATVRLGYADGYSRKLGRNKGAMWVNGQLAPIVGDVCMDMTMIDITDIPGVQEADEVEVFGVHLPIEKVAAWAETIPYEILTSIGQRVKRVYLQD